MAQIDVDDDSLRRAIDDQVHLLVHQKVFAFLEFKLQGAIEAFVAGQRLTDPNATSLETAMTLALEKVIEKEVKKQLANQFAALGRKV